MSDFKWDFKNGGSGGGSGDVDKAYVDQQDAATLQNAKDYSDDQLDDRYEIIAEQLMSKTNNPDTQYKLAVKKGGDNYSWSDASPPTKVLYVKQDFPIAPPISNMDGSFYFPFDQVQDAINAADSGDSYVIMIDPGTYSDVEIINKTNITLVGIGGATGSYSVELGDITIGGNSTRVRLKDIDFNGDLNYESSAGLNYIDNCSFKNAIFTNTNTGGYIKINNSYFNGVTLISGGAFVDLYNCQIEGGGEINMESTFNGTVICSNCNNIGLQHDSGLYISRGDTNYTKLDSTATVANGRLLLIGGSMFNGTTYIPVNKTGDCPWCMTNFTHEPLLDTPNPPAGQKIDSGTHTEDVYCHYRPTTYAPLTPDVTAFFRSIDVEFVTLRSRTYASQHYAVCQPNILTAFNGDLGAGLLITDTNGPNVFGSVSSNLSIGTIGVYEIDINMIVKNDDPDTNHKNLHMDISYGGDICGMYSQDIQPNSSTMVQSHAIIKATNTGDIQINCSTDSSDTIVNGCFVQVRRIE